MFSSAQHACMQELERQLEEARSGKKRAVMSSPSGTAKSTPVKQDLKKQATGKGSGDACAMSPAKMMSKLKEQLGSPSPMKTPSKALFATPAKMGGLPEDAQADPYLVLDSPSPFPVQSAALLTSTVCWVVLQADCFEQPGVFVSILDPRGLFSPQGI